MSRRKTAVHIRCYAIYDDGADVGFHIKEGGRIVGMFPPIFVPLGQRIEGKFPFTIDRLERGKLDPLDANKLTLEVLAVQRGETERRILLAMAVWGSRDRKFPKWQLGPPGGWLGEDGIGVAAMPLKIRAMPPEYREGSITIMVPVAKVGVAALAPRMVSKT